MLVAEELKHCPRVYCVVRLASISEPAGWMVAEHEVDNVRLGIERRLRAAKEQSSWRAVAVTGTRDECRRQSKEPQLHVSIELKVVYPKRTIRINVAVEWRSEVVVGFEG